MSLISRLRRHHLRQDLLDLLLHRLHNRPAALLQIADDLKQAGYVCVEPIESLGGLLVRRTELVPQRCPRLLRQLRPSRELRLQLRLQSLGRLSASRCSALHRRLQLLLRGLEPLFQHADAFVILCRGFFERLGQSLGDFVKAL